MVELVFEHKGFESTQFNPQQQSINMMNVNVFFRKMPQPGESSLYERVQSMLRRNQRTIDRKELAAVGT